MIRTNAFYKGTLHYNHGTGEIMVIGVNDLILISTECNGKIYEKLTKVKQLKTRTADEVLAKAVDATLEKIAGWLYSKSQVNGRDFYNHAIKTNQSYDGLPLGGYFEMILEDY